MVIMIAVIVMVTAAAIAVVVMTVRFGTIRRFGHFWSWIKLLLTFLMVLFYLIIFLSFKNYSYNHALVL